MKIKTLKYEESFEVIHLNSMVFFALIPLTHLFYIKISKSDRIKSTDSKSDLCVKTRLFAGRFHAGEIEKEEKKRFMALVMPISIFPFHFLRIVFEWSIELKNRPKYERRNR